MEMTEARADEQLLEVRADELVPGDKIGRGGTTLVTLGRTNHGNVVLVPGDEHLGPKVVDPSTLVEVQGPRPPAATADPDRRAILDGLRDFVAFLEAHPHVPEPLMVVPLGYSVGLKTQRAAAEATDGMDAVEPAYQYGRTWGFKRFFGPVGVQFNAPGAVLGQVPEVPEPVMTPFTPEQLAERALVAAS